MKKILILGAGNAQIDIIEYCKKAKMEVYCCSYSSNDPAVALADHFARIDIVDRDQIESYYREHNIDQIYSIGSDISVPVIAAVAEHTGTRTFVSQETASLCCDKGLMRNVLKEKNYTPSYIIGSDPDTILKEAKDRMNWPLEIKPIDSQGQRGVSKVRNEEELREGFKKAIRFSRKGEVILEEFIKGYEVSVNAYLFNGDIIFSVLSDREPWPEYPGGIIHQHHIPSRYEKTVVHQRILSMIQDIVRAVGVTDGPVYFQIMIREDNPYLIEVTPRLDGCHLWKLIRKACGVDLLEITMNHLLYGDPYLGQAGPPDGIDLPQDRVFHLEFFCQPPGRKSDSSDFLKKEALYRSLYYQDGEIVNSVNGYMEKCGYRIYEDNGAAD